jgi:hypothetical protein
MVHRCISSFVAIVVLLGAVVHAAESAKLEIVKATWTDGKNNVDVSAAVAKLVKDNCLDLKVDPAQLGVPAPSAGRNGQLEIVYKLGDTVKTESFARNQDVWIASMSREQAKAIEGLPELRKKYPDGIVVLSARYGLEDKIKDVTDILQSVVSRDSLSAPVTSQALGDPGRTSTWKRLHVVYHDGKEIKEVDVDEFKTLQIGPRQTSFAGIDGGLVNLDQRLAALRQKYPQGILVLLAVYDGKGKKDVTELLQSMVYKDSLTASVDGAAFGDPGNRDCHLRVVYHDGKAMKEVELPSGKTIQVGNRRTSIVGPQGGLINLDQRIAELRKAHPDSLLIIDAKFGHNGQYMDITDRVQDRVKGMTVSVKASTEEFGDPRPGSVDKEIEVTYFDGEKVVTTQMPNGGTLTIDSTTVADVGPGGVPLTSVEERVEAFRQAYGDGLLIIEARYGSGNRGMDVREILQRGVVNDRQSTRVGDGWPDPAPGAMSDVSITYWDGTKIRTASQAGGTILDLRGVKPDAIKSLVPAPATVSVGKMMTHTFGAKGRYALRNGPAGASLDATGKLTWTPRADQVGRHVLRFSIAVDDKVYYGASQVEVVGDAIASSGGASGRPAVGGTSGGKASGAKTGSAGAVPGPALPHQLGDGPLSYAPGLDYKTMLVLRPDELIILAADGITVQKRGKLEKQYTHIAERKDYFVALSKEPRGMDFLDKTTFKPTRTIKLPYRQLTDMVLHPLLPISFVAVEDPVDDGPRYRVVTVDEKSGEAREPENLIGNFLAIDPSGTRLYTGYKDVYQKGTRLFMNPDGRIWDTPEYGNIDILMIYDLNGDKTRIRAVKERPGANGAGLRLSSDGKRLTYLSFVGYPLYSGAIPGWDPTDLQKKPATYECKDKTGATKMNYHPTLPLVVVPTETGALLFERENGDEQKDRIQNPVLADGSKVEDAWFSSNGENVILLCRRGETAYLVKAPIKLTAAEKDVAKRGVPAPTAPPPPIRKIDGAGTGKA